jgi:hypothetical protein
MYAGTAMFASAITNQMAFFNISVHPPPANSNMFPTASIETISTVILPWMNGSTAVDCDSSFGYCVSVRHGQVIDVIAVKNVRAPFIASSQVWPPPIANYNSTGKVTKTIAQVRDSWEGARQISRGFSDCRCCAGVCN